MQLNVEQLLARLLCKLRVLTFMPAWKTKQRSHEMESGITWSLRCDSNTTSPIRLITTHKGVGSVKTLRLDVTEMGSMLKKTKQVFISVHHVDSKLRWISLFPYMDMHVFWCGNPYTIILYGHVEMETWTTKLWFESAKYRLDNNPELH